MKRFWVHCLILFVASSFSVAHAGRLRKVWEVDLKKALQGLPVGQPSLPVFLLRFSPDGRQLAIVVDWYEVGELKTAKGGPLTLPNGHILQLPTKSYRDRMSHLLVLKVEHPEASPKQFEIDARVAPNGNGARSDVFGWTPDGQIIYAGSRLIHVADGRSCDLPEWFVTFIRNERAIYREHDSSQHENGNVSHFRFADTDCEPQEKWEVPENWTIRDVYSEGGLLLVNRHIDAPSKITEMYWTTESLIIDPQARKILHRWTEEMRIPPGSRFADSGKAVCAASDARKEIAPLACWDVGSGQKIGEASKVHGGSPFETAIHASRIVASNSHRRIIPFSVEHEYGAAFRDRVVWDFRSGKELVRWRPEFQTYVNFIDKQENEPYRFTISPDGEYVAEGGNGIIRLYKIVP